MILFSSHDQESIQRNMLGTRAYRKTALVRARKMDRPFKVMTLEGMMTADAGDYLVSDFEMTHVWPVRATVFERTYEEV